MNASRSLAVLCLAALIAPVSFAAERASNDPERALAADAAVSASSSSSVLPDSPVPGRISATAAQTGPVLRNPTFRPFSSFAIGVKIGTGGAGLDVATPLSRKLNLRGSASFFSYNPNLTEDGIAITGTLTLKTVNASLDFYPLGGSFRISPGVTMYNGNHVTAIAAVPGGQTFTLDNTDYYSSAANPVTGTFDVAFGNKEAPSLTIGWGNMIPRKSGQHWSVPFEIGFEYINVPTIALNLTGSVCQGSATTNCQPVQSTPAVQANVQGEQAELQSDISPLRFYPILSIGLSYKFGKN
jgi:hypothetical protein